MKLKTGKMERKKFTKGISGEKERRGRSETLLLKMKFLFIVLLSSLWFMRCATFLSKTQAWNISISFWLTLTRFVNLVVYEWEMEVAWTRGDMVYWHKTSSRWLPLRHCRIKLWWSMDVFLLISFSIGDWWTHGNWRSIHVQCYSMTVGLRRNRNLWLWFMKFLRRND